MNLFLTGATGFVGKEFLKFIKKKKIFIIKTSNDFSKLICELPILKNKSLFNLIKFIIFIISYSILTCKSLFSYNRPWS
jgi:dTDP-4-dehydrorhamnose reductase